MNATADNKTKKTPILIIIALVILVIGATFTLGGSLLMLGASLLALTFSSTFAGNIFTFLSSTTMLATFGCLTIPGIVILALRLSPKHQPKALEGQDPYNEMPFSRMLVPNILLTITVLLLVVTYLASSHIDAVRWLLPFLQIPAVLTPIYWVYQYSTRKVFPRPTQRNWIALGLDLTLQPLLAVIFEIIFMVILTIPIVAWLAFNPDLLDKLMVSLQEIQNNPMLSIEQIESITAGWLENPWVIFFIQLFVAVLVPLLEELIKPFLVWRWIKRPLTAMDGFLLGLIGGASFTIYENFGNLGSMVVLDDWYTILLARLGTSLLHMGTSALLGWALMKTFSDRKVFRIFGIYTVSVLLHGGWNFFAIIQGFAALPMENPPAIFLLAPIASPILILIATICGAILIFGANTIKNQQAQLQIQKSSEAK